MVMNKLECLYINLLDNIRSCPTGNEAVVIDNFIKQHPMLFSPRQISKITNIDRLLYELDKRLLIYPSSIAYLNPIVEALHDPLVSSNYKRYCYALEDSLRPQQNRLSSPPPPRAQPDEQGLTREVRRLVADNIGRKCMELGRQLSVPEAQLDNIDDRYRDHDTKMVKIFDIFQAMTPPSEQVCKLVKALDKAKKRDLAEKVQAQVLSP